MNTRKTRTGVKGQSLDTQLPSTTSTPGMKTGAKPVAWMKLYETVDGTPTDGRPSRELRQELQEIFLNRSSPPPTDDQFNTHAHPAQVPSSNCETFASPDAGCAPTYRVADYCHHPVIGCRRARPRINTLLRDGWYFDKELEAKLRNIEDGRERYKVICRHQEVEYLCRLLEGDGSQYWGPDAEF
ncbi:hypothetical protein BD410DRAFT_842743 [Rickenella mellea]|uniref:Uncharacterized protein n=1 Tax=Rickenella mellea TaxID=50990 RepID=A0A4Y7PVL3_9AGAM|nr:hypothetical protein BD410DRAFT_842743 [Rickenella mellea]